MLIQNLSDKLLNENAGILSNQEVLLPGFTSIEKADDNSECGEIIIDTEDNENLHIEGVQAESSYKSTLFLKWDFLHTLGSLIRHISI